MRTGVMLFFFNDVVFDIGDPGSTVLGSPLAEAFPASALRNLRIGGAVSIVREHVLKEPFITRTNQEAAQFLAALISWKSDTANAMLAVAAPGAASPAQVHVRLADLSLVLMHQLYEQQALGRLNSQLANRSVWSQTSANKQAS